MDDGRIAFYDGEYSWLVPDDGGQDDGEQFYYMQDMTEDEALCFLL